MSCLFIFSLNIFSAYMFRLCYYFSTYFFLVSKFKKNSSQLKYFPIWKWRQLDEPSKLQSQRTVIFRRPNGSTFYFQPLFYFLGTKAWCVQLYLIHKSFWGTSLWIWSSKDHIWWQLLDKVLIEFIKKKSLLSFRQTINPLINKRISLMWELYSWDVEINLVHEFNYLYSGIKEQRKCYR